MRIYLEDRSNIENYKSMLSDYLVNYHNIYNLKKPFNCLNPNHEDKHPSMMFTDKYNICKCFSCGVSYDLFDLIGIDYNVDSFKEQLEIVEGLYYKNKVSFPKKDNSFCIHDKVIDYTNYFKKCESNIDKTDYLIKRNIDVPLISKYKIGYDDKRNMIIFPINKYCYFARSTIGNLKIKSKGISYLWNEELLKNPENNLIYVTEGIIDSLSLETIDSNVKTIALNGLSNYKRLLKVIEECDYKGNLVLAFDNDKTGLYYQDIVKEELAKLNVGSFSITLIDGISFENCKDLNEALINNKDKLIDNYDYFDKTFKQIIDKKTLKKESEIEL